MILTFNLCYAKSLNPRQSSNARTDAAAAAAAVVSETKNGLLNIDILPVIRTDRPACEEWAVATPHTGILGKSARRDK